MHAHVATARVERKSVSAHSVVGKSVVNVVILTYTQYNTSTDHIRIVAVYVDTRLLAGTSQPTASLKYVILTEVESRYPPVYIWCVDTCGSFNNYNYNLYVSWRRQRRNILIKMILSLALPHRGGAIPYVIVYKSFLFVRHIRGDQWFEPKDKQS